jgi:hypothetical protein
MVASGKVNRSGLAMAMVAMCSVIAACEHEDT